jgi:protein SCO1/2
MRHLLALIFTATLAIGSPCLARALDAVNPIATPVDFEPHVSGVVSATLQFRDETDKPVRLGEYFGSQPMVLVFTYYGCSNLCPTMITNLVGRLAAATVGHSVHPEVIVLSVNPDDSVPLAAQKKVVYLSGQDVANDDWHFLIGDPSSIGQLAQQVGLRYVYDSASHQYAHPAGIVLLTPQGTIASYLLGFDFTSAQLANELSNAAAHRTTSRFERVLLVCFHYSPLTGVHSARILGILKVLSGMSLFALAAFGLARLVRKHRDRVPTS